MMLTRDCSSPFDRWRRLWPAPALALLLLLLLAAGCKRADAPLAPPTSEAPAPPPAPESTLLPPPGGDEPERRLVVWAPDFMMLGDESPAQRVLNDATIRFEQAHPDAEVELQAKAQNGPAAMLPYLRSAQQAAPTILPDLVLIRTADLWQMVDMGLAQPLDGNLAAEWGDFYPFALDAATYQSELYGIPFAVELMHVATAPDAGQPGTWDELLAGGDRYLFQGRTTDAGVNPSLLAHYLAAGGELAEEASPASEPLTRLFSFYRAGMDIGVFADENVELTDLNGVWREFAAGAGGVADIRSGLLLAERDALAGNGFQPVMTDGAAPVTPADVWAFALLTADPVRQADALAYVEALLEPSSHGRWTEYVSLLPSTRAAVATWDDTQPYYAFLRELLEGNVAVTPGGREFEEFARRLQIAQQDVLSGEKSVDEAVAELMLAP